MSEALALSDISKTFHQGDKSLPILRGVNFDLQAGEMVALVGPSGAGKSTLLQIAGLLDRADGGSIRVDGKDCARMADGERTELRRKTVGFVYQYHHLLPEFSALENVVIPQMIGGLAKREARERASQLLRSVGLGERLDHRPARLSGGEQQRVAIARALANAPRVLLADEPTGNLDPGTAAGVFDMLTKLVKGTGVAALIATHNFDLARRMDRVLKLEAGQVLPA